MTRRGASPLPGRARTDVGGAFYCPNVDRGSGTATRERTAVVHRTGDGMRLVLDGVELDLATAVSHRPWPGSRSADRVGCGTPPRSIPGCSMRACGSPAPGTCGWRGRSCAAPPAPRHDRRASCRRLGRHARRCRRRRALLRSDRRIGSAAGVRPADRGGRRLSRPGALRLLITAESAGALAAAEMHHAGLPWSRDDHERLLEALLGPRVPPDRRPVVLERLAVDIRAALAAPALNPDSPGSSRGRSDPPASRSTPPERMSSGGSSTRWWSRCSSTSGSHVSTRPTGGAGSTRGSRAGASGPSTS